MAIADRMSHISPFHVMDILARARQLESDGRDIVHMEVGEPDFVTLSQVTEAGRKALADGMVHYTPAVGLQALRQAIADYYARIYEIEIPASRIVVTPGASGALQLALGVTVNPDDEVLMADPGYPCNRHMVRMFEGHVRSIPVTEQTRFQLTAELVAAYWNKNTKLVMLASPSNPTGTLIDSNELEKICEFVSEKGGLVVVDEIYHGLVYGELPHTAVNFGDNVIVINSFSKYFGMTGWRLGWLVAPEQFIDPIDRLAQNIFLAAPTMSQHAAITALSAEVQPLLDKRRDEFRKRRDYLLPALRELGFGIECEPQGAFYLYADSSGMTDDSMHFCRDLLDKAGVAITPGADFGDNRPSQFVRFAYTTSMEQLETGVSRIRQYLAENHH
ncbi:MAG: pyridoxal phosphate-dependent aminotransferase [Gammaproteobacteria bacterium]|nr:MAG: pyridoxal phosphate-dependent aminotransferase [Gammaproteobacteria bacterium]